VDQGGDSHLPSSQVEEPAAARPREARRPPATEALHRRTHIRAARARLAPPVTATQLGRTRCVHRVVRAGDGAPWGLLVEDLLQRDPAG